MRPYRDSLIAPAHKVHWGDSEGPAGKSPAFPNDPGPVLMRTGAKHKKAGIEMRNATGLDIRESIIGERETGLLLLSASSPSMQCKEEETEEGLFRDSKAPLG